MIIINGVTYRNLQEQVEELTEDDFSGDYNDLTNKPDLSVYELKSEAFSGDYDDLTNKPTLFSGDYDDLTNKPDLSIYAQSADLATVAFSGSYSNLSNKPDLSVYELKADAFSGNYNDLTNKPTIPDAVSGTNDGTNWTSLTVGNDTYSIPSGGGTGKVRLSYTYGPTAYDESSLNSWLLNMPFLAFNAAAAATLTNVGFTDVHVQDQGTEFEIQGYIGIIKDDHTLAVITTENRTGTNTLVNRTNTKIIPTMKQVANKDFMITDARFRGYNTSLASVTGQDPLGNALSALTVCSIALIAGYQPTVTADSAKNFVLREGFTISISNPDSVTYQDQVTPPTTDGTYTLKVTVSNGLPTFSWELDQA